MKKDIHFQTATLLPPETNVSPTNSDQNRHILSRKNCSIFILEILGNLNK